MKIWSYFLPSHLEYFLFLKNMTIGQLIVFVVIENLGYSIKYWFLNSSEVKTLVLGHLKIYINISENMAFFGPILTNGKKNALKDI